MNFFNCIYIFPTAGQLTIRNRLNRLNCESKSKLKLLDKRQKHVQSHVYIMFQFVKRNTCTPNNDASISFADANCMALRRIYQLRRNKHEQRKEHDLPTPAQSHGRHLPIIDRGGRRCKHSKRSIRECMEYIIRFRQIHNTFRASECTCKYYTM